MSWTIGVTNYTYVENYVKDKIRVFHFEAGNIIPLEYGTKVPRPNILMIAATHGDEPAGYHALKKIKEDILNNNLVIKRGSITLIPKVNEYGLKNNERETNTFKLNSKGGGGDINRSYSKKSNEKPKSYQAKLIQKYMKNSDLVLDFHEGYDFHKIDSSSIGSTLHSTNFNGENTHAQNAIQRLNQNISDPMKKWTLLKDKADIPASCRYYAKIAKTPHILIETTGKLNKQPLHIRVNQNSTIIDSILGDMGII